MSLVKDVFTEKDGVSFCPVRAAFIIGFIALLGYSTYDIINSTKPTFMVNAKDWMTGLAQYLGFGGSAIAGKNFTEKE